MSYQQLSNRPKSDKCLTWNKIFTYKLFWICLGKANLSVLIILLYIQTSIQISVTL